MPTRARRGKLFPAAAKNNSSLKSRFRSTQRTALLAYRGETAPAECTGGGNGLRVTDRGKLTAQKKCETKKGSDLSPIYNNHQNELILCCHHRLICTEILSLM
jgi:hypothetical protein